MSEGLFFFLNSKNFTSTSYFHSTSSIDVTAVEGVLTTFTIYLQVFYFRYA